MGPHRKRSIVSLASLFLFVSADAANKLRVAPMLPTDLFCNAKIGQVKLATFGLPARAFSVSGKISIVAPRADKTYLPSATVLIIGKAGSKGIGLKGYIDPKEPDQLQLGILSQTESVKITSWPWRLTPVQFIVAVTVDGELKVDVGGVVATAPLDAFEPESIEIGCSTGKLEFQRVSAQAW